MLCNSSMSDLNGSFLVYFLHIGEEWLDEFVCHVANNINARREDDYNRYMALWHADEYLKYYDCVFEKLVNSETCISKWCLIDIFKTILAHGGDELVKNRQESWIMHIIKENAMSESIVIIFEVLSEADTALRKRALLLLLSINDDYQLFEKISLDASDWGGHVDEIIPQLTKRIEFLESLISDLKSVKYLKHVRRIRKRIEMWKAEIRDEEIREICCKLY